MLQIELSEEAFYSHFFSGEQGRVLEYFRTSKINEQILEL